MKKTIEAAWAHLQALFARVDPRRKARVQRAIRALNRYQLLQAEVQPGQVCRETVVIVFRRPFEPGPRPAVLDVQRLLALALRQAA
jgi:hypothetical protein